MEMTLTDIHKEKKLDEENALREARRKEREEQHLYLNARVMTDRTFQEHTSTDLTTFDINEREPGCAKNFRVLRSSTIKDLATRVGTEIGQDPRRIRFWFMVNRQNKTVRPDQPITDVNQTIEQAHQKLSGTKTQEIRLWAEEAENVDANGDPIWPGLPVQQVNGAPKSDTILLFLKWFDIDNQTLKGIGHVYIGKERKVEDLVPLILQRMGWPDKLPSGDRTQLKLYEASFVFTLLFCVFLMFATGNKATNDRPYEGKANPESSRIARWGYYLLPKGVTSQGCPG